MCREIRHAVSAFFDYRFDNFVYIISVLLQPTEQRKTEKNKFEVIEFSIQPLFHIRRQAKFSSVVFFFLFHSALPFHVSLPLLFQHYFNSTNFFIYLLFIFFFIRSLYSTFVFRLSVFHSSKNFTSADAWHRSRSTRTLFMTSRNNRKNEQLKWVYFFFFSRSIVSQIVTCETFQMQKFHFA